MMKTYRYLLFFNNYYYICDIEVEHKDNRSMGGRYKSEILSGLLSIAFFSVVFAGLYSLFFLGLGLEKTASWVILVFMASLCVTDFAFYHWKKKKGGSEENDAVVMINRFVRESRAVGWLKKKSSGLLLLFAFLWIIVMALLVNTFGEELPDVMEDDSVIVMIVGGLLLAPVIETLIFQVAIIKGCKRIAPKVDGQDNLVFAILVSSLLFGAAHGYSLSYVIYGFLMGLALASFYVLVSTKPGNTWRNGFWMVVLLHFVINSIAFLGSLAEMSS